MLNFLYGLTFTSHMTTEKPNLTAWIFVGKVMSLLFTMLSSFVIAFLPKHKQLLISWLQSPSAVILEPKKIKSLTVSIVSPSFAMKWWDWMPWSSLFESWILSQLLHSPHSPSSRGSFEALQFLFAFCCKGGVICISEVIDVLPGNLDSSLCFSQPGISHDVFCIWVK